MATHFDLTSTHVESGMNVSSTMLITVELILVPVFCDRLRYAESVTLNCNGIGFDQMLPVACSRLILHPVVVSTIHHTNITELFPRSPLTIEWDGTLVVSAALVAGLAIPTIVSRQCPIYTHEKLFRPSIL